MCAARFFLTACRKARGYNVGSGLLPLPVLRMVHVILIKETGFFHDGPLFYMGEVFGFKITRLRRRHRVGALKQRTALEAERKNKAQKFFKRKKNNGPGDYLVAFLFGYGAITGNMGFM